MLAEAEVKRDIDILNALIADDYLGIDPSGAILTKKKILDTYGAGLVQLDSITSSELHIRVFGEIGMVTGRSFIKGNASGQTFAASFRYSDTYRINGGAWQLIASQLTPIIPESPTD